MYFAYMTSICMGTENCLKSNVIRNLYILV